MDKAREPVTMERREKTLARPITAGWPFDSIIRWAEEMDRIFENLGSGPRFLPVTFRKELEGTNWMPAVEIFEKGGQFVVRSELPGLRKEDVNVEIEEDTVTIRGERKQESEEKKKHFFRSERSYGSFYRVIPLPEGVRTDHAKATFKDGVLEVTMPAPPVLEKRVRHVEITETPVKEADKAAA